MRRLRIFLNDHMRIGPARTEGRDPGDPRNLLPVNDRLFPCPQRLIDNERRAAEVDMGIQLCRVQRRHDLLMLHLQQYFRQSGDAGRRFAMTDVRFRRSDQAEAGLLRIRIEGFRKSCDLDRVA